MNKEPTMQALKEAIAAVLSDRHTPNPNNKTVDVMLNNVGLEIVEGSLLDNLEREFAIHFIEPESDDEFLDYQQ